MRARLTKPSSDTGHPGQVEAPRGVGREAPEAIVPAHLGRRPETADEHGDWNVLGAEARGVLIGTDCGEVG